jgi:hypothetical protein
MMTEEKYKLFDQPPYEQLLPHYRNRAPVRQILSFGQDSRHFDFQY